MKKKHRHNIADINEIVKFFLKLTDSFSKLHSLGVIHHDIKPSNILIDFGCANTKIGTINYLAPEQFYDMSISIK